MNPTKLPYGLSDFRKGSQGESSDYADCNESEPTSSLVSCYRVADFLLSWEG